MPVIVPIEKVLPGNLAGEDIFNLRGDLLLGKNVVITRRILENLKKTGLHSILVACSQEEGILAIPRAVPKELALKAQRQIRAVYTFGESRQVLSSEMLSSLLNTAQDVVEHIMVSDKAILTEVKHIASHDMYTYEHSWMVFLFTFGLIREAIHHEYIIPPDPPSRNSIAMGALLHDFGKTQIPLEVLNKEGKLSRNEMRLIQEHPQIGVDLLRDYESINPFTRSIILHHHQRWDGKGYGPASGHILKGNDIPPYIHLVTLADVFDALISDRPYREGFLPRKALDILHQASGSFFNPKIAPFIDYVTVDYPIGSVLLVENGTIVNVNGLEKGPLYRCYVVGSLTEKGRPLLGETFYFSSEQILCSSNSIKGLAERLSQRSLEKDFFPGAPLSLTSMEPWKEILEEYFKPLL
ncbi:MAG TPA: HD domain-containing protein [Synergistaceae bacterium]|nr:HD domain-containing protein [Synergistaceae bacterium]HPQ37968.1 HD domain-containing protein [Synergistaceae bacterium]